MKFKILTVSALALALHGYAQNPQPSIISGGYDISGICTEGKVYAWGQNQYGTLGTGQNAPIITQPTQVPFPTGVSIKQLSPGSGSHFLAVDCKGNAWAWSTMNESGQLGNGTNSIPTIVAPAKVKAGSGPADSEGNLTNVSSVAGGSSNSFALLTDGKLVAWGSNFMGAFGGNNGMLGNNTEIDSYTPVYVLNGEKAAGSSYAQLEKVIQVQAGESVAYALVSDGNGTGTVYSWGNGGNGELGRSPNGGPYSISSDGSGLVSGKSTVARPVAFRDGKPLKNIVSIAAGDVFCLALDVEGNVWAWGNNAWGGCTGQGASFSGAHTEPRKVIKGDVTGSGTDGIYLKAKSIAAGQGIGMAVTLDGKPVSWGNNGPTFGGILGNGIINVSSIPYPVYIINSAGVTDKDVVSISRSDLGGFYTKSDNSIMTWGVNNFGQLGIGSTTPQYRAVKITLPANTPDPAPYVFIPSSDTILCEKKMPLNGITLNTNFNISTNAASYKVTWFKNGVIISDKLNASTGQTLKVESAASYVAKIEYVGTNIGCQSYPAATDTFTVKAYPASFTVPGDLIYCSPNYTVYVNPANPSLKSQYYWYPNSSSTLPIGKSNGNDLVALKESDLFKVGDNDVSVWVEEAISARGIVGPANNNFGTCQGNYLPLDQAKSIDVLIKVFEDITIDSIDVYQKEFIANNVNTKWQFSLYDTKPFPGSGALIRNNKISDAPLYLSTSSATANETLRRIPVGLSLKGSKTGVTYALALTSGGVVQYYQNCQASYPYNDNIPNAEIVQWTGSDQFGTPPPNVNQYGHYMFNMQFSVAQKYCNRVPVTLSNGCITSTLTGTTNNNTAVMPNPFQDRFSLKTNGASKYSVVNASGILIEESKVSGDSPVVLGDHWPKGLYLIQLYSESGISIQKVIKE
ncbi:T9SS type A sorting domain-containing protein [Sporocytophaga myxococcoides]|uniref:T9SS type A sorting domain-containing protein n=1 Tax=Sporocytophaga myxococcoides TaxID=153721 RepID=UPI0003FD1440|nr:T9SS type A sorting domain-containing protein [Sporocytophaga myxococcoides]